MITRSWPISCKRAEEAGEDGVVGVSKTVADRYDR